MKILRLLELRQEKGLSQEEIAKYLSISKISYYKYEYGALEIPIDYLIKLAEFYNTSIDYIVGITNVKEKY